MEVRLKALEGLLEVGLQDPMHLSSECFLSMANRMVDRKYEIRRVAMIGLSKIYQRYISTFSPAITTLIEDGNISIKYIEKFVGIEYWKRLRIIPGYVMKCFGYPDMPTQHLVIQVIQLIFLVIHRFICSTCSDS